MAIREIIKYPNPILKKKSKEVERIDEEVKKLAEDMIETLQNSQGVGLAAPQINVPKRIIAVQMKEGPKVFLNPEVVKKSRETEIREEGCLCLPGVYLKVKRAKSVEIAAQDLEGKKINIKADGLAARVFQHEIDHLNGILILDKIPFLQKLKLRSKLKK
ncbi:MAG: peptide deformylase [bacterium]|nr:peptide deformylase [bacterium]